MPISVPRAVIDGTFGQLRRCGDGRRECVAYWYGPLDEPGRVTDWVHPSHTSSAAGYEVDTSWVTSFFLDLRRRRETARVQVHTHPRLASHSDVDDEFALAPATGFVSLVIPNFALGPAGLDGTHVVVVQPDGTWLAVPPMEVLAIAS